MKKTFIRIMALVLVGIMMMSVLAACKKDAENPNDDTTGTQQNPLPTDVLTLAKDGTALYRIVLASNAGSIEKNAAALLTEALKKVTGADFVTVTDAEDKDNNADIKEILVGNTSRTESKELKKEVKVGQYGIATIGNKIVLIGATYDLLTYATETFLRNYVGYIVDDGTYTENKTLTMPLDVHTVKSLDVAKSIALYVTDESVTYADALAKALLAEMDEVKRYTLDSDASLIFDEKKHGTVIIAGAQTIAADAIKPMRDYMNYGGKVLFLGGPTFETIKYKVGGKYLAEYDAILASLAELPASDKVALCDTTSLVKADSLTEGKWYRNSLYKDTGFTLIPKDCGLAGSTRQIYYKTNHVYKAWDTISTKFKTKGTGYNSFGIWAKAMDDHTGAVYLELLMSDGTKWYTVLSITQEWQYFYRTAEDFTKISGKSNEIDFAKVNQFSIGFVAARLQTTEEDHSFAFAEPSFYKTKLEFNAADGLDLDTVYPLYKQYPITNAAHMITEDDQAFILERNYVIPSELISCHPGTQGMAFDKGKDIRFVPLIRVTDSKNLFSGYAAWMNIIASKGSANSSLEGTVIGYFSAVSNDFYNADGIAAVVEAAAAMTGDTFLVDGGAENNIYITADSKEFTAGATFVDLSGKDGVNVTVEVMLYSGDTLLKSFTNKDTTIKKQANFTATVSATFEFSACKPDRAVVVIKDGDKVIDKIEQDIRYWTAKPEAERKYFYVEDGVFKRKGDNKTYNFFGTSFVSVLDSGEEWDDRWYDKSKYDPEVIEYEFDRLLDLGMNAVSFSFTEAKISNNIIDILDMAERKGLYVELAFSQLFPMAHGGNVTYTDALADKAITGLHVHEMDNIVALEIGWEYRIGKYDESYQGAFSRKNWNTAWYAWILEQYGTLENAYAIWGQKLTMFDGGPYVSDAMFDDTSGAYQKVIEAYLRFADDQVIKEFMPAMNYMRSLAPNHMFTFRMNNSGAGLRRTGFSFSPSELYFDFQAMAPIFDYMEPEGYKYGPTEDQMLQMAVGAAYARYTKPDAPVVLKEFGYRVWEEGRDDNNFRQSTSLINAAAELYKDVFEYALDSHVTGLYCWWYTPGFRIAENSDCGIINPDGSDRGNLTKVVREYAEKIKNMGARPTTDVVYIEVERADVNAGIFGIYEATKDQIKQAIKEGKYFEFVDKNQDTAFEKVYADTVWDMTLEGSATAGVQAPLRYVNGAIKDIKIVKEGGKTYADVVICNTKQTAWRENTVSLVSTANSAIAVDYTISEEVDYLDNLKVRIEITGTGKLELRFEINGYMFGYSASVDVK